MGGALQRPGRSASDSPSLVQLLKLAAAALNQTPLAWAENLEHIVAAMGQARDAGVAVLCLPELCVSGYGCEDAFHSAGVVRTAHQVFGEILPETHGLVVAIGLPVPHEGRLYNAAALVCDGQLAGLVGKQHLAGDGIHYEPRWFSPWLAGAVSEVTLGDRRVPFGDLAFDCNGVRIGFEICEDAWVSDRPGRRLAQRQVDIILNPSASHFAFDKQDFRERLVRDGSRAFHASYVFANLLGNEAGRAIYDGGSLIATSGGQLVAAGQRFSFCDVCLTTAVVDIEATRTLRERDQQVADVAQETQGATIRVPFTPPAAQQSATSAPVARGDWETGPSAKEEEFARAVSLALFDYHRKSRARGFVVSLSGGADSSAVAVLVGLMAQLAVDELGLEVALARLGGEPAAPLRRDESRSEAGEQRNSYRIDLRELLTCVYQSTRNSSDTTRHAAREVAQAVNARFIELDVDHLVESYKSLASAVIERPLDWARDDLALQNIQARARGPSVWLLANLHGALLLTTSNRSEAAVGYATMDGDTCGGLAPVAGIDKAFLTRWLVWMEHTGPLGVGPLKKLVVVNAQQPTAELRPPAAGQTDEQDLMPYEVLDAIERAAIRDKLLPREVFDAVRPNFSQHTAAQLGEWVERFFRLWCRNQWKRERYAPSFHLDDENLDPKTWCRFPILSGGYQRELDQLREYLQTLTS